MDIELKLQPKQELFLYSHADIAIGGGAAGGGKTYALMLEPLRYYKTEKFNSVLLRRTYPEITKSGGVWDEAAGIYPLFGGVPNLGSLEWRFPRYSSKISFGHLTNEQSLNDWKSAQIALLMFDQLETFTERMFFYMLSRNRSTCGIKTCVRATANPEPNWLANFLSWWIAEDGYADPNRIGKVRWFIRAGDQIVWADSPRELKKVDQKVEPKSVTFIPFSIYDNPILMGKDPSYLASLQALPLVDRERLLGDPQRGGNWKIKPSAGNVFSADNFVQINEIHLPSGGVECRYYDLAATVESAKNTDPDYTASVSMRWVDGKLYVTDCTNRRIAPGEVRKTIIRTAMADRGRCERTGTRYMIRWEQEPGSASKRETWELVRELQGYDCGGHAKTGSKLSAWKPLAAQVIAGNVHIINGEWNRMFLEEMHGVPDIPHDDVADAAAGAYNMLVQAVNEEDEVEEGRY